jgi:hypothetical protein
MHNVKDILEKQAEWQRGLRSLPWPEKVRMAEALRDPIRRFRQWSGTQPGPEPTSHNSGKHKG